MLFVISPAKALDYETPPHVKTHTQPLFVKQAAELIDVLRENIDHARKELARIQGHLAQYQTLARNLGLGDNDGADHLISHQAQAQSAIEQIDAREAGLQADAEHAIAQAHNAHTRLNEIQAEHDAVRQRPGSNLPVEFQRFRAELADHLGLPDSDLPFAAELVEVGLKITRAANEAGENKNPCQCTAAQATHRISPSH